ncbi:hypothetical protein CEXT_725171 [Caerostris extrusa]|uniref:Uncharacterized protein n=1 Tax=Caerostris extrusa TaxID=172846 RepID=A0AAV4NPA0_CAEEX|nr:hypothetical protein CEXT_725171 [Caerostris extrusa]
MDAPNDQISTNKPPLLPKPCLNPSSSEPTDHVIPQMVITSADDEAKEIQIASEALPIYLMSQMLKQQQIFKLKT